MKYKAIVSLLLAVSMIFTPVFSADNSALIDTNAYDENIIYCGLPKTGTEEVLQSGVRFAAYPTKSGNLQVQNNGAVINASYKKGTTSANGEILEAIFSGYPVSPLTHEGIVLYEWKVRFNEDTPSKIIVQSRDSGNEWGMVSPVYNGFFSIGTYTIGLMYNTVTGEYNLTLNGTKMASRNNYPHSGIISTDIKAPQLQFTFKNVNSGIDILEAKLAYYEKSSKVLYDGIPSGGISESKNGVTFMAAPNNYGITAENSDGVITAFQSDNYKSGDYIKFILSYPAASATHSGSVTYEFTVRFSGTTPGPVNVESMHTKNDWAFANAIPASYFVTDTDYVFTVFYEIATAKYTVTAKKSASSDVIFTNSGVAAGGAEAGLQAPYFQWKPRDASSKVHFVNAKVIYTGHAYTLRSATLGKADDDMVANINVYKARAQSVSDDNVKVMVAGYNDDNKMTSFTLKKYTLSGGENELQLVLNEPIENLSRSKAFLWYDKGLKILSCSFSDGLSDWESIMNMDYMIENIYLKDCKVFMTDSDFMYADGERQKYPDNLPKPQKIDDTFMVPSSLLESILGLKVSLSQTTGAIKVGNSAELMIGSKQMKVSSVTYNLPASPKLVDSILYLPFEMLMEKGFGKDVYCDERGMIVLSDNTFVHADSEYFLKVFDTVDHIYRYMQYDNPRGDKMISDAQNIHPKLILTPMQRDYVLSKIASKDARWLSVRNDAVANADAVINSGRVVSKAPADAEKQGAAAQYAADMKNLSMGYLLTENIKYAERAAANLENAIKWDNLGESTAQLTMGDWALAVALTTDVFYDYLNASDSGKKLYQSTKTAVKELLFKNLIAQYKGNGSNCRWVKMTDNFTGVCGGGIMMLLLSLSGEEELKSDLAYLIENVYKSLQIPLGLFGPDGGWYEGVSYGNYCFLYIADALVALKNTCGTLYGLEKTQGFKEIPDFYLYMSTPNSSFNFHDMPPRHENAIKAFSAAYLTGDTLRLEALKRHRELSGEAFDVTSLMFYDMSVTDKGLNVNLDALHCDRYFKNAGTGGFLSSLTEKNPTFAGFHGGYTGLVHDSLDMGAFYFEADGVTWAYDLGSDYYSLPEYFVIPDGYRHYRKNPQGENCIVINPIKDSSYYGQKVGSEAELIKYETSDNGAMAALDITEGYERDVTSYVRGYLFGDNRKTLTVRDELMLKQQSEVYWFMHTPASVEIIDKDTAVLSYGTKKCTVEVACSNASFELKTMDANLLEGSPGKSEEHLGKSNSHVKKLAIHFPSAASGNLDITVKLTPQNGEFISSPLDADTPIKLWEIN